MLKRILTTSLFLLSSLSFAAVAVEAQTEQPNVLSQSFELININDASAEALASLKGIGKSKAQAIVDYREQHGKFRTLNDLLEVKGIGEKVLNMNAGRITI